MSYSLRLVTAPASEPITLAQAKVQCRIESDSTAHDDDLTALITEARVYLEKRLSRQLFTATWDLFLDEFPASTEIYVPLPPLQSVTHLKYYDTDGTQQTWSAANYHVSTDESEPGRIVLAPAVSWPAAQLRADAVNVRFVAGWTAVPEPLKRAVKLLVGEWFLRREDALAGTIISSIPTGVERIIATYLPGDEFTCYTPGD
jgi:uncharacterized phiE125 gp8 family phage protein